MKNQKGFTPAPQRAVDAAVSKNNSARLVRGFTLIELLVVIGIIAILASVVIVAVNPTRQFQQSRDSGREASVRAILDAIGQNMVENNGTWSCPAGALPTSSVNLASTGGYDIYDCIVPDYVSDMPVDPSTGTPYDVDTGEYDAKYSVVQDEATLRVTVSAPSTEIGEVISITR